MFLMMLYFPKNGYARLIPPVYCATISEKNNRLLCNYFGSEGSYVNIKGNTKHR